MTPESDLPSLGTDVHRQVGLAVLLDQEGANASLPGSLSSAEIPDGCLDLGIVGLTKKHEKFAMG
jgi:hypothetical protein